eukprot:scaffold43949_cov50-Phaeocystis_antarctica.AAC.2
MQVASSISERTLLVTPALVRNLTPSLTPNPTLTLTLTPTLTFTLTPTPTLTLTLTLNLTFHPHPNPHPHQVVHVLTCLYYLAVHLTPGCGRTLAS